MRDIVVGDIVELRMGDRIPADCILIEEMNITVDESLYFHGKKSNSKDSSKRYKQGGDNHTQNPDPFLYTDSKILSGYGKAVVCCVGKQTVLSKKTQPDDLIKKEEDTELERKLSKTANKISNIAKFVVFLSIITHLIFQVIIIIFTKKDLVSNEFLLSVLKIGIIAVVLMIVAIPEGLPLAVSIAMALSISRLKQDKILIKNIESIQSAAMLHDLCVGKTGILTTGKLTVRKYQIGNKIPSASKDG